MNSEIHDGITDTLLSRKAAAAFLGVSAGSLAVWASTKRYPLPFIKVGRLVRYRLRDLEAFVASRTVGGKESA